MAYSALFLTLGADIHSELWDEWEVGRLSKDELQQLAVFLGMTRGYSLRKSELATRILGIRQIWLKIRKLGGRPCVESIVASLPRYALAAMMRELGYPRTRSKRQLAETLVLWHAGASLSYPRGFPDPEVVPHEWLRIFRTKA